MADSDKDPRQTQRDAADRTLSTLEKPVLAAVEDALTNVARGFAKVITASGLPPGRIVAQGEPVDELELAELVELWDAEVPGIAGELRTVYTTSGETALRRWEGTLEPSLIQRLVDAFLAAVTNRLRGVGDTLWEAARDELAAGVREGESTDQLRDRLQESFATGGTELGESRAETIARTETAAAWNTASSDYVRALPDGPGYKTWLSTLDHRTRTAHATVDLATIPADGKFIVGGAPMDRPLDPAAPPGQVINCRCVLTWSDDPEPPSDEGRQFLSDEEIEQRLADWEERGIVREADIAAAAEEHTSGMIALVPSDTDLDRLPIDGYEPREELHLTLLFLGDADNYSLEARQRIIDHAGTVRHEPIDAMAFGAAHWNPGSEAPCWVLNVGDADGDAALGLLRYDIGDLFRGEDPVDPEPPPQHTPFAPHICLAYTDDTALVGQVTERVGPVTFDRIRVAFGTEVTDIPLGGDATAAADATWQTSDSRRRIGPGEAAQTEAARMPEETRPMRRWSTPGNTAIAFEDTETGDGRIFVPGALYWENGSWPLQYAGEMLGGHDGAVLVGPIDTLDRDGRRITATGGLYVDVDAARESIDLLDTGAPLGISVDLDDVSFELVYKGEQELEDEDDDGNVIIVASARQMRVLHTSDGYRMAVSGVAWMDGGRPRAGSMRDLAASAGWELQAAAGDQDSDDGEVLFDIESGDEVFRITRARVRGATLVAMPAFADARIVLDAEEPADTEAVASITDTQPDPELAAATRFDDVIRYVNAHPNGVRAKDVANALGVSSADARSYLVRGVDQGKLSRIDRGLYGPAIATAAAAEPERDATDATVADVVASVVGDVNLPIHDDPDREWDGDAAASRILEWAQRDDATDGEIASRLAQGFLWRDDDANPAAVTAYSLPFVDVFSGALHIVRSGVLATAGGHGVDQADIPEAEKERIRGRICGLYERVADKFDEDLVCPWERDDEEASAFLPAEIEASAWTQFQALPPMPAAWFAEPTEQELPPKSGGVHVTAEGRIYGWVVKHGVPHDGHARQLTLDQLLAQGDIDTTRFLRRKRELDDGSSVNVGAFTMNVGHHRDGGECETAQCQFDNTRTVAGIVTVGLNKRGMWFTGAAAPWLASWDLEVFATCQPSYRVRQLRNGQYSLRAVLSVPMPGHPSELAASAMALRSDMALSASAATPYEIELHPHAGEVAGFDYARMAVAMCDEQERREAAKAEVEKLRAQLAPARAQVAANLVARVRGTTQQEDD